MARNSPLYFSENSQRYYILAESQTVDGILLLNDQKIPAQLEITKIFICEQSNIQCINQTNLDYSKILKEKLNCQKWPISSTHLGTAIKQASPYAKKCLDENKSLFVLYISARLYKRSSLKKNASITLLDLYLAALAVGISKEYETIKQNHTQGPFCKSILSTWDEVTKIENSVLTPDLYYTSIFNGIVFLNKLAEVENLPKQAFADAINKFLDEIPQANNPLGEFSFSFFNSFLQTLDKKKVIKICRSCSRVFKYKDNQIYCNASCRKKLGNAKYYSNNRPKQRARKKIDMQEHRSFLKSKGVKK